MIRLLLILSSALLLFTGCGISGNDGPTSVGVSASLEAVRQMNDVEIHSFGKICNALNSKKENFPRMYKSYDFKVSNQACAYNNPDTRYQDADLNHSAYINMELNSSYTFIPTENIPLVEYFNIMVTDENSEFQSICFKTQQESNERPSIQEETGDNSIKQWKIASISTKTAIVDIYYFVKSSTIYKNSKSKRFVINIDTTSATYGSVQEQSEIEKCDNSLGTRNNNKKIIMKLTKANKF